MPEENTGIILATKASKRNSNSEYQICTTSDSQFGYKKMASKHIQHHSEQIICKKKKPKEGLSNQGEKDY